MGAWIETSPSSNFTLSILSLPIWERGLKPTANHAVKAADRSLPIWERGLKPLLLSYVYQVSFVAPYMGAWIETYIFVHFNAPVSSLPIWERGLKLVNGLLMRKGPLSLPIWERGLKHRISVRLPRSGLSLPIWERGLKQR